MTLRLQRPISAILGLDDRQLGDIRALTEGHDFLGAFCKLRSARIRRQVLKLIVTLAEEPKSD